MVRTASAASSGGIVFVNFNYRVGALGFLASETIGEDGDLNAGLLDQRLMLEWVQKHIAKVSHERLFGRQPLPATLTHTKPQIQMFVGTKIQL